MRDVDARPEAPRSLEELIKAAQAGSSDALGQLLEAWRDYLLRLANQELDSGLVPKAGASDLVQETFLEAQRAFAQFRGATGAEFVTWLSRILEHNVANLRRAYRQTGKRDVSRERPLELRDSSGNVVQLALAAGSESPSAEVMGEEEQQRVRQAMERLPEDYRRVIALRHQEDRSFVEIGEIMGRSADAARKLWLRAVERLSQELGLRS